jgi:predicted DNA-binding protein YlxM (UPF0122 family)
MTRLALVRDQEDAQPSDDDPRSAGRPEPCEPGATDLAWYYEWAVKHRSVADIAAELGVTHSAVHDVVRRTELWMRRELFADVVALRVRQTELLERAAAELLQKWGDSSDIRFLAEARRLLLDIRKMWGVDKPPRAEAADARTEEPDRVAGRSRADALRAQAARLIQAADELDGEPGESECSVNSSL